LLTDIEIAQQSKLKFIFIKP